MPYIVKGGWTAGIDQADRIWFEYLDGDMNSVTLIDPSQDGGLVITKGHSGRPVHPEFMPTKIGFRDAKPGVRQLMDFEGSWLGILISNRAKLIIEALEPGRHQFFPVEIFQRDDAPETWNADAGAFDPPAGTRFHDRKIADYWMFNICARLDTMDRARTVGTRPGKGFYIPSMSDPVDKNLVLSSAAIDGAQAWVDSWVMGMFFSDALVAQIQAAGLTGLRLTHVDAV
jgi:hypothetical protein